ncbi:MAG: peptide-methionine (S)-S-oxide reductase MsrA [Planctomycetota bacterium]
MKKLIGFAAVLFATVAMMNALKPKPQSPEVTRAVSTALKSTSSLRGGDVVGEDGKARAYFASGCFWCVEAIYESVLGVEESISGYSGGRTENPTYASSNTGLTGHAEAVEIIYDPQVVDFATLVDVYFGSQNVTQQSGQGPDRGSQYRSIVFFQTETQEQIINEKVDAINEQLGEGSVAAEVTPFEKFWVGEDYHQNYERLNPNDPYVRTVSIPRLNRFKESFPHLLKASAQHP